jgi:hypothetical protein
MFDPENKKNSNKKIQVGSTINTNHSDMEKRLLLNESFNSDVIDDGLGHIYGSW